MSRHGVSEQAEERLDHAVTAPYETFCPLPVGWVSGCPHCVDDDDQRAVRWVPLRHLTGHDLRCYAFKALTTWGDADPPAWFCGAAAGGTTSRPNC